MEAILYAVIYLICIIFVSLLVFWTGRSGIESTVELWQKRTLISFLLNFVSNFLFTLFNRVFAVEALITPLSYGFKTLYFVTMAIGVYCWCGCAETTLGSPVFARKRLLRRTYIPLAIALAMPAVNLFTHWMFDFSEAHAYQRHFLFPVELAFLFLCSSLCSVRLLRQARREGDPFQQAHLRLTATFPLCILAALLLSFIGEAVPVICVCIVVELQCLHMGTTRQEISLDKLTQVNNRQNLIGFINYKMKNHAGEMYLLMMDLDDFKSINDTYGHLEGDRALVQLSTVLKKVCGPFAKRPYIARYGGDEFIVVMEGTEQDVETLCARIREELSQISSQSETYRLSISVGRARWRPGMDHKALIAEADAELYKNKPRRRG